MKCLWFENCFSEKCIANQQWEVKIWLNTVYISPNDSHTAKFHIINNFPSTVQIIMDMFLPNQIIQAIATNKNVYAKLKENNTKS